MSRARRERRKWVETRIPQVHVALHRLGVAAHQLGGRPGAASQVVRGEYLHDLRRGFGQDLFSEVAGVAMFQLPHSQVRARVDSNNEGLLSIHLEFSCPSARSALSAYLESDVSVVTSKSQLGIGQACIPQCIAQAIGLTMDESAAAHALAERGVIVENL